MPEDYSIAYFMICDDVRIEKTGKEIIIRAYNDTLITNMFPFAMPTICLRVSVREERPHKNSTIMIKRPDGETLVSFTAPVNYTNLGEQTIFNFQSAGAQFPVPG